MVSRVNKMRADAAQFQNNELVFVLVDAVLVDALVYLAMSLSKQLFAYLFSNVVSL